jgi:hypothetical protein
VALREADSCIMQLLPASHSILVVLIKLVDCYRKSSRKMVADSSDWDGLAGDFRSSTDKKSVEARVRLTAFRRVGHTFR